MASFLFDARDLITTLEFTNNADTIENIDDVFCIQGKFRCQTTNQQNCKNQNHKV